MVHTCAAFGCSEKRVKGGPFTFHSFPSDKERQNLWLLKIRRRNFIPTKNSRICSKHFTEDCFDQGKLGGTWLKMDAVPTIFNFPPHFRKEKEGQKSPIKRNKEEPTPILSAKTRKQYLEDFDETDMYSPTKARQLLSVAKRQSKVQGKIIKELHRKNRRMEKKIYSLQEILQKVIKKSSITQSANGVLESLEKRPEVVLGSEPSLVLGLESNLLMTTVTPSDMVVELDPTTLITPDVDPPDLSAPGPSRMEPDSSMMEQDIHLAMTCDVYPADAPEPDSVTTIKEEPIDPDVYNKDILSATVVQELRHFSKDSSVTSEQKGALFQPPVLIKEEPVSSEEEL